MAWSLARPSRAVAGCEDNAAPIRRPSRVDIVDVLRLADRPAFEPLSFTVRFKPPATPYLWFWFAVNVVRSGVEVFPLTSFDNFILTLGSPHWCGASTPPADPLPHR